MSFKIYFLILCFISVVASTSILYIDTGCKGDPNAIFNDCPSYCPRRCDDAFDDKPCTSTCAPPGCICKPGYIMSTEAGKCVKPEECPPKECNGDPNAVFSYCLTYCPQTCIIPDVQPCTTACAPPGCACKPGYVISHETGRCVKPENCPPKGCKGDPNAVFSYCRTYCPRNCLDSEYYIKPCIAGCAPPGCACIPGYVTSHVTGKCVKPEDCPPKECKGDPNAVHSDCPSYCPRTCNSDNGQICIAACAPPGCVCKPGYVISDVTGKCVKQEECPPKGCNGDPNAVYSKCPTYCPLTCDQPDLNGTSCIAACAPPGCVCKSGYLLDNMRKCVKPNECSFQLSLHSALPEKCPIPKDCIRTCASPNPPNCPYKPCVINRDGCECMEGYILSQVGGVCIRIEYCPIELGCNGDLHARTKQCPLSCPPTCDSPNFTPCKEICEPIGCECIVGYIYCKESGKCVLPDQCPGGNPCGINEEFRQCIVNCPEDYCPVDDRRNIAGCDFWPVCISGCACKWNHKRLSQADDRCVVASDCPPVYCTRPNEVWDGCPSDCFSGYCEDKEKQDTACNTFLSSCQPKCICKRDYFRNSSDICVHETECPPTCTVPHECFRTCDSPNPLDCPYKPSESNIDGCNCMKGYILSEIGRKCIRIEECPPKGCNGDPNAVYSECPSRCPLTCDQPDRSGLSCVAACAEPGCVCKSGYILDQNKKCVKPDECPGL